jgi:hypothetical protein
VKPLILALLLATSAFSEWDWATKTGTHEGAFFRFGFWGTPAASSETKLPSGSKVDLDNAASMARIQLGWSVMPRLALHVDLLDILVPESDGIQAFTWGPGFTAYSPKGNFFATATYGYSIASVDGDKNGTGSRLYIGLGKEFQVSECNGIGIMATWEHGSWEDKDTHQTWKESGPGFQFTWTYN